MLGTQFGLVCYSSQAEAAASFCGALSVQTSAGLLTCDGVSSALSSSLGGRAVFDWTAKLLKPALSFDGTPSVLQSSTSTVAAQVLQPCEAYGYDYFEPIVISGIALLISVWAGRRLISIFWPESWER